MGRANPYATSYNGHYVYANVTWDNNLLVTVNLTSVNAGWCIKIRGTNTIKCSGSMSNTNRTFYADYDGQEFTLQVYDAVEETYVNNGNPVFKVTNNSSGDDSSGDSGGSGSGGSDDDGELDYFGYLWIYEGIGTKITVTRTEIYNPYYETEGDYLGELVRDVESRDAYGVWYKHKAWEDDEFMVIVEALPGYTLNTYDYDYYSTLDYEVLGEAIDYSPYTDRLHFRPNVNNSREAHIRTTAVMAENAYQVFIDDDSEYGYAAYQCYIDNGETFEPYMIYIDNGSSWEPL